jgi:hypothetical protein
VKYILSLWSNPKGFLHFIHNIFLEKRRIFAEYRIIQKAGISLANRGRKAYNQTGILKENGVNYGKNKTNSF